MNKQIRRNPIHINEEFRCEHCKQQNEKADKTCRNHCRFCLYSKHVDAEIPGDRLSKCKSLMVPVRIEYDGKKGYQILHQCLTCEKEILNKAADDDNRDKLINIMQNQNIAPLDFQHPKQFGKKHSSR